MTRFLVRVPAVVLVLGLAGTGSAAAQDLIDLTLEQLLQLKVTSASRKEQSLSETPASVYVVTSNDIRRSGLSSIPEVLRLVPGVQVARYSNGKWAIGARGFGRFYSNKLLVLVDGRSVYTPDFSGVYWELLDLNLEDVDRIEVIRGPGGSVWGANAVNGVINIITKQATETAGTLVALNTGSEMRGLAAVRYGSRFKDNSGYRVYGQVADQAFDSEQGVTRDSSRVGRGGFRLDHGASRDEIMVQGNVYRSYEHNPLSIPVLAPPFTRAITDDTIFAGGHALGRWKRTLSPSSSFVLQGYFNHATGNGYRGQTRNDVADVEFQHRTRLFRRHDLIWGGQFRQTTTDFVDSALMSFTPSSSNRHLIAGFVQDEVTLRPDLSLSVGLKVEEHESVGSALAPSVRAVWHFRPRHHIWGAVSRGVRTPAISDEQATLRYSVLPPSAATMGLPVEVQVVGNPDLKDLETVTAYEMGQRFQPVSQLALDVSAFYNQYDRLTSYSREAPSLSMVGGPHLVVKSRYSNLAAGETYGLEAVATWTPSARWTLSAGSTFLQVNLHMTRSDVDPGDSLRVNMMSPRVQFTGRSSLQLTSSTDLEAIHFVVGPWQAGGVDGYSRTDVRFGWRPLRILNVDVGAQNLFSDRHMETARFLYERPTEIRRSGYARLTWRF